MKIVVDKIPEHPEDCLFSIQDTYKGEIYYTCTLRENIPGKHKNSPCLCKNTQYCNCLKEEG